MMLQKKKTNRFLSQSLTVPRDAILFILLQRTAYQTKTLSRLLRRLPGRLSLTYARLESHLRRNVILARYRRGIQGDFDTILPVLPERCNAILDIGCGVAGIDVLLYDHFRADSPEIYLSDYHELNTEIHYGFEETAAVYNSLDAARKLLTSNKVPEKKIRYAPPPDLENQLTRGSIDLVLSTLAWGFHFPVDNYLSVVEYALSDQGQVILDIRKDTNGLESIASVFNSVQVLVERPHYTRIVACR